MENSTDSKLTEKRARALSYATFAIFFLAAVLVIIYFVTNQQLRDKREQKQYAELANMQEKVSSELSSVGNDLLYYAQSELALATLGAHDQTARHYLSSLMYKICALQKRYDQMRLLDKQGNEIIRINQEADDSLRQIPPMELQNKSKRSYFKKTLGLSPGQIYISHFDLNKEQGKVEYPIKPMIRFATPVYSHNNELLGIGVINFYGDKILQTIAELNVHQGDHVLLLNSAGYYLKGIDPSKDWTFMFPEKKQFLFANQEPEVWEKMAGKNKGVVRTGSGEFYFISFCLTPNSSFAMVNAERVYLVMHVPRRVIDKEHWLPLKGLIIGFILIAPLLVLLTRGLAHGQVEQAWLLQKLKFEARHDALTGLYNRKAIVDYLEKQIMLSRRRNASLSVGFIDVNDLKKMNDQYGHEAGDELIKGSAEAIKMSIRESDFAARLGGDEFLIIFVDSDKDAGKSILLRIQAQFAELGQIKIGKKWSMSFGCSALLNEQDDAEKMIERADLAMYKQKTWMKAQSGR
ncbi:MAG: diguanylate cyclase [Psychromonas sp.]|nr:diguanylate cyclase [Psychromonas sp.]